MSKIDSVRLADSTALSRPALILPDRHGRVRQFTRDGLMTFDQMTIDSAGAFLIGELERLDPTLHEPLVSITWPRDIDLREDVTIADETSSFTNSSFATPGGIVPGGKSWISKDATAIANVALDIGKTAHPLYLWGKEVSWTLPELASAQKLGRPVDVQKYDAMKLAHQMDIDAQVYVGDSDLGQYGLLNSTVANGKSCVVTNLPNGAAGHPQWMPATGYAGKTPDEILADINLMITTGYAASGFAVKPNRIGLDPYNYGYISTAKVATAAGTMSIRRYIEENNLLAADGAGKLSIVDIKWCAGAGLGGTIGDQTTTNRAVCYTKDYKFVRFPFTPIQRTPIQYDGLYQKTTYFCRIGAPEFVYPENTNYFDGL